MAVGRLIRLFVGGEEISGVLDVVWGREDQGRDVMVVRRRYDVQHDAPLKSFVPYMLGDVYRESVETEAGGMTQIETVQIRDGAYFFDNVRGVVETIATGRRIVGVAAPQCRPLPWQCMPHGTKFSWSRSSVVHPDERDVDVDALRLSFDHALHNLLNNDRRAEAASILLDLLPASATVAIDFLHAAGGKMQPPNRVVCGIALGESGRPRHHLGITAWRIVRALCVELLHGVASPESPVLNGALLDIVAAGIGTVAGEREPLIKLEDFGSVVDPPRYAATTVRPCLECACTGDETDLALRQDGTYAFVGARCTRCDGRGERRHG